MIRKCCVTNCNGNCNAESKVETFRLLRNPEEKERWITITPRDIIVDSKDTGGHLEHRFICKFQN